MNLPKTRREKEIWQACDQLYVELGQSELLTGELIFEKLLQLGYSKGSPNETYRYRKTWKEARGLVQAEQERKQQDLELPDPLVQAVNTIRTQIQTEATQTIQAIQLDLQEKMKIQQQTLENTQDELQRLLQQNQALKQELNQSQQQLLSLEQRQEILLREKQQLTQALEYSRAEKDAIQTSHREHLAVLERQAQARADDLAQLMNSLQETWHQDVAAQKLESQNRYLKFQEEIKNLKQAQQKNQSIQQSRHQLQAELARFKEQQAADVSEQINMLYRVDKRTEDYQDKFENILQKFSCFEKMEKKSDCWEEGLQDLQQKFLILTKSVLNLADDVSTVKNNFMKWDEKSQGARKP